MSRIQPLESVIVDGDNAVVYVRPGDDVQQAVAESIGVMAERRAAYAALRDTPAVTRDGVPVSLHLNAGLLVDLHHVREVGADGIGLYRTELPFMVRGSFPDVPSQIELYRKVFEQIGDKPVVFRTLDIGGDKRLPYWNGPGEDNPAMGWRAIRIALDRPAMLRHQLRALIRAAEGRPLNIMFPMIAEVAEFKAARTILGLEIERARRRSEPLPEPLRVGAMLEVPALVWQLPALLRCVDFLSIGSNDLLQFMFASDRGNPRLADRYDVLSPPVLAFLSSVIAQASRAGVPVSLCGEMAGHPLEAMALVGLGMRTISMPPSAIGPVKTMTRSLELAPLQRYLRSLLDVPDHSVREKLRMFANDHSVVI